MDELYEQIIIILQQLMAFFQNLSKLVSSQLFTKTNSFVLSSCYRRVYLQSAQE